MAIQNPCGYQIADTKLFKKKGEDSAPSCDHLEIDGTYRKKEIRVSDANQPNPPKRPLVSPCPLCKSVYASWRDHGNQRFKKSRRTENLESPALGHSIPADSRDDPPLALEPRNKDTPIRGCVVKLIHNQLGEAYHALICGIILKNNYDHRFDATLVWADPEHVKMDPIEKLFDWYEVDLAPGKKDNNTLKTGAEETTQIISAAFRACQKQVVGGRITDGRLYLSQDELFKKIRKALDEASRIRNTSDLGYNLHAQYFRPSYDAKYWLNRYLALTIRMHVENVERKKRRFGPFSWEKIQEIFRKLQGKKAKPPSNWIKLPKKRDVKRMAVIHVRRTPPSDRPIGRSMDEPNLRHVARAIANVNRAIEVRRENAQQLQAEYTCLEPFSHVLLYGDFNYKEAESIMTDMEKHLQKCTPEVSVGFISRPWQNNKAEETDERVAPFWKKFRDLGFDHLPVQVKSLAIWVALCKRYSPDICVIGHRSGFIEAAAFIGIPVFYLNNERERMTDKPDRPGELLWTPLAETAAYSRLREASDVMNTLIPIESLAREQEKDEKTGDLLPLHVDPKYEHELAAALFMFMCCVPKDNTVPAGAVTSRSGPAWMKRVEIMHRAPGSGGTGPDREWLKGIYDDVVQEAFRSHP